MKLLFISFLAFFSISSVAQKNRYQFAHTYFGIESEYLPQTGFFQNVNKENDIVSEKLPHFLSNRILIGGTHFWDHADFYISIPIVEFKTKGSEHAYISNGVLTGFKYFPLKIKLNSIRPYIGIGFGGAPYRQEGDHGKGAFKNNRQWYYEGGISYRYRGSKLFELGTRYFSDKEFNYFISRTESRRISLTNFSFLISYKKLFDFTQGYAKESMKKHVAKTFDALEKNKALNTFSVGIGYSATIPLEATDYSAKVPFLNQETTRNGNPELGLAYYSHDYDAAMRLSFRPLKQKESAYGYTHQIRTNSVALEAFKFLGDYHGFVPFIGPYLGANNYRIKETDDGNTVTNFTDNRFAYGLVFGWDIRLSTIDYLILRTNLRYTPDLNYKKDGLSYTNKQLEFNFIQLVYYPKRHKIQKSLNN